MEKQVKKIVELFGAKDIKEDYKVRNIVVIPEHKNDEGSDFDRIEIQFHKNGGVKSFVVCVDYKYYLQYRDFENKKGLCFKADETKAMHFTKDKIKNGKIDVEYPTILRRAMESIAIVLEGRFEKEIDIGDE